MADFTSSLTLSRDYNYYPSARGAGYYGGTMPQPPSTRAHFRNPSATAGFNGYSSTRGPSFSPRFTSDGSYASANVSPLPPRSNGYDSPEHRRPLSYPRGSDEDGFVEIDGVIYSLPSRPKRKGHMGDSTFRSRKPSSSLPYTSRYSYPTPQFAQPNRNAHSHARRSSTSTPQRPQTARPSDRHVKQPSPEPKARATEADAKRSGIPAGYSLKNWDPTEEPITLLGSVFDANSLGKWIYDWTVYRHGPATPISDMAGEMWLLLIQLSGKIRRNTGSETRELGDKQTVSPDATWEHEAKRLLNKLEKEQLTLDRLRQLKDYHGPPDTHAIARLLSTLCRLMPPSWAIKTLLFAALPTLVVATSPNNNPPSQISLQDLIIQITAAISLAAGIILPPLRSNDEEVSTNRIYWIAAYSVWGASFAGLLLLELRRLQNWLQRRLLAGMVLFSGLNLLGSLAQGSLDGAAAWAPLSLTVSLVLVPVVIEYLGPREAARLALTSEAPESRG